MISISPLRFTAIVIFGFFGIITLLRSSNDSSSSSSSKSHSSSHHTKFSHDFLQDLQTSNSRFSFNRISTPIFNNLLDMIVCRDCQLKNQQFVGVKESETSDNLIITYDKEQEEVVEKEEEEEEETALKSQDPSTNNYPDRSRNAFFTFLENDNYLKATLVLGYSIDASHTKLPYEPARRIVLHFENALSDSTLCQLHAAGWETMITQPLAPFKPGYEPQFKNQFVKLRLWDLEADFDTLVYLDSDTLVVDSLDELFDLLPPPHSPRSNAANRIGFAAVPDVWWDKLVNTFNAGMMVIRTNSSQFQEFIRRGPSIQYNPLYAEQEFLNTWYKDTYHKLPRTYNFNVALAQYHHRIYSTTITKSKVWHFTVCKPFIPSRKCTGAFGYAPEMSAVWDKMWYEVLVEYDLEGCKRLSNKPRVAAVDPMELAVKEEEKKKLEKKKKGDNFVKIVVAQK